jgi:hypothetical protein
MVFASDSALHTNKIPLSGAEDAVGQPRVTDRLTYIYCAKRETSHIAAILSTFVFCKGRLDGDRAANYRPPGPPTPLIALCSLFRPPNVAM